MICKKQKASLTGSLFYSWVVLVLSLGSGWGASNSAVKKFKLVFCQALVDSKQKTDWGD